MSKSFGRFARGAKWAFFLLWVALTAVAQNPASEHGNKEAGEKSLLKGREAWFRRGRTVPGESSAALLHRAYEQKIRNRSATLSSVRSGSSQTAGATTASQTNTSIQNTSLQIVPTGATWVPLGPAPLVSVATTNGSQDYGYVSGRATAVAVDPNDSTGNTVYLGGAYGGVWKTTNALASPASVIWTPLTDDQATLAVGAIAVQPGNSSVVLVGTGEPNSSADSYYGLGILRSHDGGATWENPIISSANNGARPFQGMGFSKIAFSTDTPNIVVAAAAGATMGITTGLEPFPDGRNRGLYYSTDAGQIWSYASVKDGATTVAPGSATSVVYNAAAQKFFAALRYHGIFTSSNGRDWTRLATQPGTLNSGRCPSNTIYDSCPLYRAEIAVVPGRNEMYVWYVDRFELNYDDAIFQTTDGGASWTTISTAGIGDCHDAFPEACGTTQGAYNLALAAVPSGSATDLYAGAINLFKCSITTANPTCQSSGSVNPWTNLTHVYGCTPMGSFSNVHPDQHALDFPANHPEAVFVANDGGIYRTLDSFSTAQKSCNNIAQNYVQFDNLNQTLGSMTQFVWFSQHPSDEKTLLGGTQDNGSPAIGPQSPQTWLSNAPQGQMWKAVNNGDGGFTAINPNNGNEWFTELPNVGFFWAIQRCTQGIDCNAGLFDTTSNNITSGSVGGDDGAFYTPYMLDPQKTDQIIVGTCRVWRGPSNNGALWSGANALSYNFSLGSGACSSNDPMILSLAAGGLATANGSQVIYAGTENGRIFVTTNADGGPTSWQEKPNGINNPSHFPISAIAIDRSAGTGKTAYLTVMGFGTGHVYKTTDAGDNWTDITGNLPDAPADAVAVDPNNPNVVYVGTDVGVFAASDTGGGSNTVWEEIGPAGGTGSFPNVAVTALSVFNGDIKKLRASTYGRGVWEIEVATTPDFRLTMNQTQKTVYPGSEGTLTGTLTAVNNYSGQVSLSCGTGKPSTCTVNPGLAAVGNSPVSFTVTMSDTQTGTYDFNITAIDGTITHQQAVQFGVADFEMYPPNPSSLQIGRGLQGQSQVAVRPLGPFEGSVTVTYDVSPEGPKCTLNPSGPFQPSSVSSVDVSITVPRTTSPGPYTVTLTATATPAGASPKTQSISLDVTVNPDFYVCPEALSDCSPESNWLIPGTQPKPGQSIKGSYVVRSQDGYSGTVKLSCTASGLPCMLDQLEVSTFPATTKMQVDIPIPADTWPSETIYTTLTAADKEDGTKIHSVQPYFKVMDFSVHPSALVEGHPGATTSVFISLQGMNEYHDPVNLLCSSAGLGACTLVNQVSFTNGTAQATAYVAVAAMTAPGTYTVVITGTDATYPALERTKTTQLNVTDFQLIPPGGAVSVAWGGAAKYTITMNPLGGGFGDAIHFRCVNPPQATSCSFTPNDVSIPSSTPITTTLTITTTAPGSALLAPQPLQRRTLLFAFWLALPGLLLGGDIRRKRLVFGVLVILMALIFLQACGGGGGGGSNPVPPPSNPGTPPGTYTVNVAAGSGSVEHTTNVVLTVTQ